VPNSVVLRRELVKTGRKMYEQGLVVAAEGNLSVRLRGHCFLVTPSGAGKGDLRVQDLLEVGLAGNCPLGKITSEWLMHQEIYKQRSDVNAICHAHPPWATAFSVAGRDLDGALLTETAEILPRVPLAPRAKPGTDEVPFSVAQYIPDFNAILLGNHGVVTVGHNLQSAFFLLETVERLAQITLLAEVAAGKSQINNKQLQLLLEVNDLGN